MGDDSPSLPAGCMCVCVNFTYAAESSLTRKDPLPVSSVVRCWVKEQTIGITKETDAFVRSIGSRTNVVWEGLGQ